MTGSIPAPSFQDRAQQILARSSLNQDEKELWLLLFEALDELKLQGDADHASPE
jgi:hypothetical protein